MTTTYPAKPIDSFLIGRNTASLGYFVWEFPALDNSLHYCNMPVNGADPDWQLHGSPASTRVLMRPDHSYSELCSVYIFRGSSIIDHHLALGSFPCSLSPSLSKSSTSIHTVVLRNTRIRYPRQMVRCLVNSQPDIFPLPWLTTNCKMNKESSRFFDFEWWPDYFCSTSSCFDASGNTVSTTSHASQPKQRTVLNFTINQKLNFGLLGARNFQNREHPVEMVQ